MMDIRKQTNNKNTSQDRQRSYNEIVEFLDKNWACNENMNSLDNIKQLDQAFGSASQKLNTIFVNGTNGKSLTIDLTVKLLNEEKLKVGAFCSPHTLTYNERLSINRETIPNKVFTEIANTVINKAEELDIKVNTYEILTMMAIQYFTNQQVDVAILEVNAGGKFNPVNICNAKVATITRIAPINQEATELEIKSIIEEMMGIVKPGTWFVSGDQNKANLQLMNDLTDNIGANWAMPIRKLAPLAYPFEQLHGRCAALAERLAQIYIEYFHNKNVTITSDSLLSKQKGQRGRPTIEAKRQLELIPKKTIDQFWKETTIDMPGRFQFLDKEKPSILLDTASNIDAFKNVLLGIRLLHYQRPLKGLTIIMAAAKDTLHQEEFLKAARYFFKKTSGQLLVCPIDNALPGLSENESWDVEKVTNDIKSMKIKAKGCKNFEEAFELAKKSVDERNGLVVITGSHSIVHSYWKYKGIKKF